MFVFGHMGIGKRLAGPFGARLPTKWLLLGTLMPDIIDKCIFYISSLFVGIETVKMSFLGGSRAIGHTGLFLIALSLFAYIRKSKILAALVMGMATHLVLDNIGDHLQGFNESSATHALLFPLYAFSKYPFSGVADHLHTFFSPVILGAEALGAFLLFWEFWKLENRKEISQQFREKIRKITKIRNKKKFRRI